MYTRLECSHPTHRKSRDGHLESMCYRVYHFMKGQQGSSHRKPFEIAISDKHITKPLTKSRVRYSYDHKRRSPGVKEIVSYANIIEKGPVAPAPTRGQCRQSRLGSVISALALSLLEDSYTLFSRESAKLSAVLKVIGSTNPLVRITRPSTALPGVHIDGLRSMRKPKSGWCSRESNGSKANICQPRACSESRLRLALLVTFRPERWLG